MYAIWRMLTFKCYKILRCYRETCNLSVFKAFRNWPTSVQKWNTETCLLQITKYWCMRCCITPSLMMGAVITWQSADLMCHWLLINKHCPYWSNSQIWSSGHSTVMLQTNLELHVIVTSCCKITTMYHTTEYAAVWQIHVCIH